MHYKIEFSLKNDILVTNVILYSNESYYNETIVKQISNIYIYIYIYNINHFIALLKLKL